MLSARLILTLVPLALHAPEENSFRDITWQPDFVEAEQYRITKPVVALFTHCSRKFDPLGVTAAGVRKTAARMKVESLPILYLHDRYNSNNPPWMYLYDDWKPTAYVSSDIGHIKLNLTDVRHVICLGGYFGQCERATLTDVINSWHRSENSNDFRVTQIVDAIFTVGQHLQASDAYDRPLRDFLRHELKSRHKDAVLSIDQILRQIDDPEAAAQFLQRQPQTLPTDVNIVMDVLGDFTTLQWVGLDARTLTLGYRRSDQFLDDPTPEIDTEAPRYWVRRNSRRTTGTPVRIYEGRIISEGRIIHSR